jgi:ubiquinone/menaquinone biosynthesis C-methylase UbiE
MTHPSLSDLPLHCPNCTEPLDNQNGTFRCDTCDREVGVSRNAYLDFMLDEEIDQEFQEFYEQEGTRADDEGGPRINAQKFKIPNVLKVLPETLGINRYLDMGCGGGWIMESLIPELKPSLSVGLDISSTRLMEAQRRNPNSLFLQTPVENVPIPDNSFDLITCLDVIEHIKRPDKLLREANRLTSNLVIKFPIEDTLFDRFQKELWWPLKRNLKALITGEQKENPFEAHLHRFNFDSARKLLRQHGFRIKAEHIILNPWTEGESFMYPPAYNIDEHTRLTTKIDFHVKRSILKGLRMATYATTGSLYYSVFNSGIYFYCQSKS